MLPFTLVDRLRYILERQLIKGVHYQLLVVALFIGLISLIGGWLAWPTAQADVPLADSVWWAFLRLTDPGYLGDDEGTWRRIISTALTIMGYVVFMGTLVAIMTRWLISKMGVLEEGLTPVTISNHVVILGWTNRTIPLVQEIMDSAGGIQRLLRSLDTRRLRLVILSDTVNIERTHELRDTPGIGRGFKDIILRSGTPLQPEALHRVACLQAAVVMIPGRSQGGSTLVTGDMETIKALLTLHAQGSQSGQPLPYVVAEIEDVRKHNVMRRAYPGPLEIIASDAIVSRLMAQAILHPGLPEFYGEVMSVHDGNEIYLRSTPACEGSTLADVAANCPKAILLGLVRPDGDSWRTRLNVPTSEKVLPGDKLVMLARHYEDADPAQKSDKPARAWQRSDHVKAALTTQQASGTRSVLILGWNRRLPALVHELATYRDQHFRVMMVSTLEVDVQRDSIAQYSELAQAVPSEHLQADFMAETTLRKILQTEWDSILLVSSDRLDSGEEADARAMVGYMAVDELLQERKHRPQLLLELSDPANEELVVRNRSESIISPMILSHLMAQIAQRRELGLVFEELFTVGGPEIIYREQNEYPMQSVTTFADLEAVAGLQGETALGVYRAMPDGEGRRLQLNPPRDMPLKLQTNDELVILTTLPGMA
jgi:ion channel POLLUX/CASTOR